MASSSQVPLFDLKQQVPYSSQKLHQLYSYHFDRPIVHCTQMIMLLMTADQDVSMHTVHDSSLFLSLLLLACLVLTCGGRKRSNGHIFAEFANIQGKNCFIHI
jgi:hypothetical protein